MLSKMLFQPTMVGGYEILTAVNFDPAHPEYLGEIKEQGWQLVAWRIYQFTVMDVIRSLKSLMTG